MELILLHSFRDLPKADLSKLLWNVFFTLSSYIHLELVARIIPYEDNLVYNPSSCDGYRL